MEYRSPKGYTGLSQVLIFGGFVLVGLFIGGLIQVGIGLLLVPGGMPGAAGGGKEIVDALMAPKNVNYLRLAQILGTVFIMFLPAAAYSLITNGRSPFWLGFSRHLNFKQVALAFVLIFLANIVAGPLADFSKWAVNHLPGLKSMAAQMEDSYTEQVKAMSNLTSVGEYLIAIIIMAFLPAMFEEMAFRGALQNVVTRWWQRPLLAIIFSSVIFSLVHMSIYLFLSRVVLGFVLGLLFFESKNVWVNIIAHFLNNFIAVSQLYFLSRYPGKMPTDLSSLDPKVPWWGALLALAAMVVLFRLFRKVSAAPRAHIQAQEQAMYAQADPYRFHAQAPNN